MTDETLPFIAILVFSLYLIFHIVLAWILPSFFTFQALFTRSVKIALNT